MKKIILFIITLFFIPHTTIASEIDCNKYDKLSKEYTKCKSKMIKKNLLKLKIKHLLNLMRVKKNLKN